ncbi:hypothetical protein PHLCEN_2v3351 [Hermanssonia centrifuga]|uniref:Uncharacterized protein n=1 Tax=Hermanssonia centrifuga TaxID=98765 RepID=A0A2R6QM50_9APHY|nr:hypothetical protein PHLCEN_2v3351 [Hermanssonia centrifuga]
MIPDYLASFLRENNISFSSLVIELFSSPSNNLYALDLLANERNIFAAFLKHPKSLIKSWAQEAYAGSLTREVKDLTKKENGWHFGALRASAEQIEGFKIEKMSKEMQKLAPGLWALLDIFLSANTTKRKRPIIEVDKEGPADEAEDAHMVEDTILADDIIQRDRQRKAKDATNHQELIVPVEILKLGQTLTAAYAFDNFDVDLKPSVPTIEKSSDTLKHLTSGLLFSLSHIISPHNLRCSAELWKKLQLNDESDNLPEDLAPLPDWRNLLRIHPKHSELDSHGMSSRDRWNAWKFLHDLCHHGPEYFAQFRAILGEPEVIEEVPLVKTKLVPARAIDINNG